MFWSRLRQGIYAALTGLGLIWTNYYLVKFTIATRGEFTPANLLNFDLPTFIDQVWANPASSFVAVDVTIGVVLAIVLIVTEGRRLTLRVWGIYIALMFAISFAFGFSLFLLMRERRLAALASPSESLESS